MSVANPGGPVGWGIAGCSWVARDYVAPAIARSHTGKAVVLLSISNLTLNLHSFQ